MTSLEGELDILLLTWFKPTRYWENIENFIDRQFGHFLLLLFALACLILFLDLVKMGCLLLQETPLVIYSHFRHIAKLQELPL
jgi:hypothetical protein